MILWFSEAFNDCCPCIHLAVCPSGELVKKTHLPALLCQASGWSKYRKGEPNTTKHVTVFQRVSSWFSLIKHPINIDLPIEPGTVFTYKHLSQFLRSDCSQVTAAPEHKGQNHF